MIVRLCSILLMENSSASFRYNNWFFVEHELIKMKKQKIKKSEVFINYKCI